MFAPGPSATALHYLTWPGRATQDETERGAHIRDDGVLGLHGAPAPVCGEVIDVGVASGDMRNASSHAVVADAISDNTSLPYRAQSSAAS